MKKNLDNFNNTQNYFKNYCSSQDRCLDDIRKKLENFDLTKEEEDKIIKTLFNEDYLNEKRFAKSYCRGKFNINKWGRVKIEYELRKKKIKNKDILSGLDEINDLDYQTLLNKLYIKKSSQIKSMDRYLFEKKIANFLINKGFERSMVWDLIKKNNNYEFKR